MGRCLLISPVAVLLGVIVAVVVGRTVWWNPSMKKTFIKRCEAFKGYDCEKIWGVFEQAYVGLDPCKVPVEAYDPVIAAAPFTPACNRLMFWSKTKDVALDFTKKRDCFFTVEKTLLGSVLDGLTWCGKEGSRETFTTGCPGWADCENNPVRSFWNRVSAAFADGACGDVSVMLNGAIDTPFDPTSVFASIEVKRIHSPKVKSLKVVLVTQKKSKKNCQNESLKKLRDEVKKRGITYDCKEVTEARIRECSSNLKMCCEVCW